MSIRWFQHLGSEPGLGVSAGPWPRGHGPARAASGASSERGLACQSAKWRLRRWRLTSRWQLVEQRGRGGGDGPDRAFDRGVGLCRARRDAGDLAHVLKGGGLDLLGGGSRLKPSQGGDVAAHGATIGSPLAGRVVATQPWPIRGIRRWWSGTSRRTPRSRDHRARCTPRPLGCRRRGRPGTRQSGRLRRR